MALLDNLDPTPGGDKWNTGGYPKLNALIDTVNAVLGGGTADQIPAKINSTDFNTAMVNSILPGASTPNLKIKRLEIGDWNMDSNSSVLVTHGLSDITAVISADAMIISDDSSLVSSLIMARSTDNGGCMGFIQINSTQVSLGRVDTGFYDNTAYNSTSFNRGYITIIYVG